MVKWIQRHTEDIATVWDSKCDIVKAPDDDGKKKYIIIIYNNIIIMSQISSYLDTWNIVVKPIPNQQYS